MPTTTYHRNWTRPAGGDPARIADSVGTPLDEIDLEVETIDNRLITVENRVATLVTQPVRAVGIFTAVTQQAYLSNLQLILPEEFDQMGWYDPRTGRYLPRLAGYYHLVVHVDGPPTSSSGSVSQLLLCKNDVMIRSQRGILYYQWGGFHLSALVRANGTTDYFSVRFAQVPVSAPVGQASFSGFMIGRP